MIQSPPANQPVIIYLGGTFDPIHLGHIAMGKHVAQWLSADQITLLPAHVPPHKAMPKITSKHRLAMLNLACQAEPLFTVDQQELSKESPSYTVETLSVLAKKYPQHKRFFIIGMDSLCTFEQWYCWQDILTLSHLIVCPRPGYQPLKLNPLIEQQIITAEQFNSISSLPRYGKILITPPLAVDISSTQVRKTLSFGNVSHCQHQLPATVIDYIKQYQLYQTHT